jgi:hypothetical protein
MHRHSVSFKKFKCSCIQHNSRTVGEVRPTWHYDMIKSYSTLQSVHKPTTWETANLIGYSSFRNLPKSQHKSQKLLTISHQARKRHSRQHTQTATREQHVSNTWLFVYIFLVFYVKNRVYVHKLKYSITHLKVGNLKKGIWNDSHINKFHV